MRRVLLLLMSAGSGLFADYKVGDTVVVIHDTQIKVGAKAVQDLPRGLGLRVQAVQGEWLWVANQAAGWVNRRDVATPERAVEIFTDQISKDHDDSDAYVRRGLAWFDEHEIDLAIADFNEAIRDDPHNASAYSSRALCHWASREVDKAIADFTQAIRLNPAEPMYLANRGILWNMKGEYDKAIADADAALRRNAQFITAHIVRGRASIHEQRLSQAIADLDEALRINPREVAAYGLRGRALADSGDYQRARRDYDRAIALNPNDKNACNEIARFYATCPDARYRDGRKAVEFAQRACELSGWRWASSITVLAAAYAETGDFDQAVKWQEKATGMVEGKRQDEYRDTLAMFKARKPLRFVPQTGGSTGSASDRRKTRTGQPAYLTTRSATEPSSSRFSP